jgi:RNA polymerase sigma-70 factor (ECF subfamily)
MEDISFDEIKKIQEGNKSIFNKVILFYKKRVADLCFKFMRNAEEASDMAQEVFALIYTSIGKFEFRSKFSTWVYRVTANYCMNRLKALKRRRAIETASAAPPEEKERETERLADLKKLPDEEMEIQELRAVVMDALKDFPEKERALVIMRDMEGLSCEDISKALDMPIGSVKSKTARAREKLRKIILRKMGRLE